MSYHYVTVSAMFCKTAYTLSPRSLRMMPGALKMSILIFVPMKTEHNNTSVLTHQDDIYNGKDMHVQFTHAANTYWVQHILQDPN